MSAGKVFLYCEKPLINGYSIRPLYCRQVFWGIRCMVSTHRASVGIRVIAVVISWMMGEENLHTDPLSVFMHHHE